MTQARLAGFATRALALAIDLTILNAATLALGVALAWEGSVVGLDLGAGDAVTAALAGAGWLVLISVYPVVPREPVPRSGYGRRAATASRRTERSALDPRRVRVRRSRRRPTGGHHSNSMMRR